MNNQVVGNPIPGKVYFIKKINYDDTTFKKVIFLSFRPSGMWGGDKKEYMLLRISLKDSDSFKCHLGCSMESLVTNIEPSSVNYNGCFINYLLFDNNDASDFKAIGISAKEYCLLEVN